MTKREIAEMMLAPPRNEYDLVKAAALKLFEASSRQREKNASRLTYNSNDEYFRTAYNLTAQQYFSRSNSECNIIPQQQQNQQQQQENDEEITQYRLIKLDNSTILVKSKDAYLYDLVREKLIACNTVKQMKIDGHKKMKEISK